MRMIDREKVIRIIDELIFEAQKEQTWKSENALRCLKKELLKEQQQLVRCKDYKMDREKVIKEYEDYVNSYISLTTNHDYEFEMHKAVLALLKEQEAVEPRVSTAEQRCGHCNKVIEMDGWIACPWCGKRIDWESWWSKNGNR